MRLMVCEECGARHYSASAERLVAQGARCERCSALLVLGADRQRPLVAVGSEPAATRSETEPGRLRRPG
jgi:hypothetical protein